MKNARKVYIRRGLLHLCNGGEVYGPQENVSHAKAGGSVTVIGYNGPFLVVDAAGHREEWQAIEIKSQRKQKRQKCTDQARPSAMSTRSELMLSVPFNYPGARFGFIDVVSVDECAAICRDAIDKFSVKEGSWKNCRWGEVFRRKNLTLVARISFELETELVETRAA